MQPTTSRDFLRVARQRFNAAEVLFDADLTLDAQYVAGYVVECAFKALIIKATAVADRPAKLIRITRGASMHTPETLLLELRNVGIRLTPEIAKRMRRFDWEVSLRYETGRRSRGETKGLLKTCTDIYTWAEEQIK
jgi:hypothetical protein